MNEYPKYPKNKGAQTFSTLMVLILFRYLYIEIAIL